MIDIDASEAKSLALVAIILQLVFFVIGIIGIVFAGALFAISRVSTTTGVGTTVTTNVPYFFGIFSIFFSIAFLIGLVWILLDYFLIYKKLAEDKVREAETPAIVLGIIQLIFGGLIPGILLIIAYIKIRDSLYRNKGQNLQNPPT